MRILIILCLAYAGLTVNAAAESDRQISVTGVGTVAAQVDMATLTLGVSTSAKEAGTAAQTLARSRKEVFGVISELGVADQDLQTTQLTIRPIWSNRGAGTSTPPKITGFEATSMLSVRVLDLDTLPALLDGVIMNGANRIEGLQFGARDSVEYERLARIAAITDAQNKAGEMVATAGATLGPVESIQELGGGPRGFAETAMRSADIPVAQGALNVEMRVAVVFDIVLPEGEPQ